MIVYILFIIFFLILFLPLFIKKVEHHLELFLLVMGVITILFSHLLGREPILSLSFLEETLLEPVKLTIATLLFGLLFRSIREPLKGSVVKVEAMLGPRVFAFALIFSLGLISSVITAIIAALILCEVVTALNLDKKYETRLVIFTCFSIGMGAALTPIGEPLSAIAVAKLRNGTFGHDFLMLFRLFGIYVVPGLVLISLVGAFLHGRQVTRAESLNEDLSETPAHIVTRAFKVYVFVIALVLLGTGFKPLIDLYIVKMPGALLYWINMSSAVLDNATLAAAELDPRMSPAQVKAIMMAVIISGGMLIPGNIPNIIAANKLRISSSQWARVGVPFGLILMVLYFGILFFKSFAYFG